MTYGPESLQPDQPPVRTPESWPAPTGPYQTGVPHQSVAPHPAGSPAMPGMTFAAGQPATLGDRFLAKLIDTGVLFGALMVLGLMINVAGEESPISSLLAVVALAVLYGYDFVLIGMYGQTLGKRAMKLRVVNLSGEPLGWGASALRAFIPMLASCATCGLGGLLFSLSPTFDASVWKRGWHDHIASSVVVR